MRTKQNLEEGFLAFLLLLALVSLLWLFSPFLEALFFAIILATATYGIYSLVLKKVNGSESLAAILTSLAVFITVIAPVSYLLLKAGLQLGQIYEQIQAWLSVQTSYSFQELNQQIIQSIPISEALQNQLLLQIHDNYEQIILFIKQTAIFIAQGVFSNSASFLIFMLLSVFVLYFLYRDGKKITSYLVVLSPLDNFYDKMIINRFANLSTILLLSVLSIALMQGISFAMLAWALGLPVLFLGMAIAVTSFIPIVGATLVWVPVTLFLMYQGSYVSAAIVVFVGVVINGFIIDNVLRPILIKKIATTLKGAKEDLAVANHTLITVLATFAGLIHFGIIGLFFGPVIAAMAITIFDVYALKHSQVLDRT